MQKRNYKYKTGLLTQDNKIFLTWESFINDDNYKHLMHIEHKDWMDSLISLKLFYTNNGRWPRSTSELKEEKN